MDKYYNRLILSLKLLLMIFNLNNINSLNTLIQVRALYSSSLVIVLVTAFFMGLVFSLQIVKEFLYLNAVNLVGAIITLAFLRELSPVLTSIILIGKIGSYFTAELGTMAITEQIEILYILGINPINYLIIPRVLSLLIVLPTLNLVSLITSLFSSCFICFLLYNVDSNIFFHSILSVLSWTDVFKSCFKSIIFGVFISVISCIWGITTKGGSKGVGISTTSSVVTSLLTVCILDFILSYYLFGNVESSLKRL
uniref:ABC transporter permease n=1 Tax=Caloglossa monosticha TaxID=76906 RepID=A0A1Z1M4I8_9FLOR|nr:hypothetical protein [Caloglossa monosticha]ARW60978.1 hypothetical protein [Caloglossa monosticha]